MISPKNAVKRLLATAGYALRKTSQIGLDDITDIRNILGISPAKTIVDVGAHEGQTAARYAQGFPAAAIYSLEPFADSFARLQLNTRHLSAVKAFPWALGDADEQRELNVNQFSATNSLLKAAVVTDPEVNRFLQPLRQVTIEMRRLDSFCRDQGIEFIDLLKLDVQGFEMDVLRGGSRLLQSRRIALIYSEVTFESFYLGQTTFGELHPFLTEQGFELVDLYGQTRSAASGIRWCDMLFVNPEALRSRG